MLKIRHFNQSIIPFIFSNALLTVFQLAEDAVGGGNAFRVKKTSINWRGARKSKLPSSGRITGNPNLTPILPTQIIRRGPKSDRSY
jgi:hypothetical protein